MRVRDSMLVSFASGVLFAVLMLVVLLLTGCDEYNPKHWGGGAGLDLPGFGVVYQCAAIDGTERVLELCWDGEENELGELLTDEPGGMWTCEATPRHLGPCWYHCGEGRGCNAFAGCYCPQRAP